MVSNLYGVLLHGDGAVDVVQLVVEAARVAHGLAVRVAAPQRRGRGLAVGARHARPLRAHLRTDTGTRLYMCGSRGFNPIYYHLCDNILAL